MKITPYFFARTTSPGRTIALPIRIGALIETIAHLLDVRRILTFYPAIESFDLAQSFLIPYGPVEDYTSFRFGIYRISKIITDQGSVDYLPVTVSNIYITVNQNIDWP